MIVRKVRGQEKVGKITVSKSEMDLIKKLGIPLHDYVRKRLMQIAKERRWKWYFNKEMNT